MKKRYIIHDEDGKEFKVEETVDEAPIEEEVVEKLNDEEGDVYLTSEQIEALKKLIPHVDKLVALVSETKDSDEECEDEEEIEETEEEVIDTDEEEEEVKITRKDSKASFNSIEQKKKKTVDSIDDAEDVNSAWANRYNRG